MDVKEYVIQAIEGLNEKEIQQVAEYIASIKSGAEDSVIFIKDKTEIDMVYSEFKEENQAMVEETRTEYQTGLVAEGIQRILGSFDQLPEVGKHMLATEILRKTGMMEFPALTDEELVMIAEESFLEYDKRESKNEPS